MPTLMQHIEDLDVDKWAALTRRAAVDAVEAAQRLGRKPQAALVAVAAMSERQLVEHRQRNGPARKHLSPVMQLVEADHQRVAAETRAREAHQGRLDAEAKAAAHRAKAEESARIATAARERSRAVEADSARKDRKRAAQRAADQEALQQARTEQRADERAADRAAAEETIQQLRGHNEQIRANSPPKSRQPAGGQAARLPLCATPQMPKSREHGPRPTTPSARHKPLQRAPRRRGCCRFRSRPWRFAPKPAVSKMRSTHCTRSTTWLEVGMAEQVQSDIPLDIELIGSLAWTVQEHARYLTEESRSAPAGYTDDAAATYAAAADDAFGAFLARIDTVTEQLGTRDRSPDAEIVEAVTAMLAPRSKI